MKPSRKRMVALLGKWVGDEGARTFLQDVFSVCEIYDDLMDGDASVNFEKYGYFLEKVLHDLPANPFFDANRVLLLPLMRKAVGDWRAATAIERDALVIGETDHLRAAYWMRTSYLDLACAVVDILSGPTARHRFHVEWSKLVNASESYEEYAVKVTAPVRPEKVGRAAMDYIFATPVRTRMVEDVDTDDLEEVIRAMMVEDPDGIVRSNVDGWHSGENSLHTHPALGELNRAIIGEMWEIAKEFDYSRDFAFDITGMWANVNPPGAYNRVHVHPHTQWSGVFYVQASEGCGDIGFHDPRPQAMILQPVVANSKCVDKKIKPVMSYEPCANQLILFPGYVPHEVAINRSAGDRISIAFNVSQRTGL